jgi:hypothetical protein
MGLDMAEVKQNMQGLCWTCKYCCAAARAVLEQCVLFLCEPFGEVVADQQCNSAARGLDKLVCLCQQSQVAVGCSLAGRMLVGARLGSPVYAFDA